MRRSWKIEAGGRRIALVTVLALAALLPAEAQPGERTVSLVSPAPVSSDTLTPRPLPADALDAYRADRAFVYERAVAAPPTSLWDRLMLWLRENVLGPLFAPRFHGVWRLLLYAGIATILIAAVLLILRMDGGSVFSKSAPRAASLGLTEDELRAMDFPALIAEAEAAGDLRRATRLRYLHVLRALVEAGRVDYAPDHTNRVYVGQLAGTPLHAPFADATSRFEAAYYGHAAVDAEAYARLCADVAAVRAALGQHEAAPAEVAA